jgi:hypothetical protein
MLDYWPFSWGSAPFFHGSGSLWGQQERCLIVLETAPILNFLFYNTPSTKFFLLIPSESFTFVATSGPRVRDPKSRLKDKIHAYPLLPAWPLALKQESSQEEGNLSPGRINPDIRQTGSPWSPSHVYAYLCQYFRRPKGDLALSHREFEAARQEYVRRAVPAYFRHGVATNKKKRRKYSRTKRTSVLDSTPTIILKILYRLYTAEFPWIILKGEFKELKKTIPSKDRALAILRERYNYLPCMVEPDKTFLGDLADMPYKLAYLEVANELRIKAESLERMLTPSARRRSGTSSWLAQL